MKRLSLLALLAGAAYWLLVRPWHLRWGATDEELRAPLPGDEFVPNPQTDTTRAVTIEAPPDEVWRWLVQMGQERAGFYSYAWLENLAGCHMTNADRVVGDWQHLEVGDQMRLHPKVALRVVRLEPGRSIVLERDWSFHVRPLEGNRTRLIVRSRGVYELPDLKLAPLNFLYWRGVFEPAHFIMERKMMLGIKQRAEHAARERELVADPVGPA